MQRIPVTRINGEVLWNGNAPCLEDFPAIRPYVDACVEASMAYVDEAALTTDFQLLLDLVQRLDRLIPWFTKEDEDESLQQIPTRPNLPPEPEVPYRLIGGNLHRNRERWLKFRKFMKEHAAYEKDLAAWYYDRLLKKRNPERPLEPRPLPPTQTVEISRQEAADYEVFDEYQGKMEIFERGKMVLREYQKALPEFKRRHDLHLRIQQSERRYQLQKHSLGRLARGLEAHLSGKIMHFEQLNWAILPGGGSMPASLEGYLKNEQRRHPSVEFDASRVRRILTLDPSKAYCGKDEFDGYLVFLFDGVPFVVLTCPRVGNALYLLKDNWETLAKLPKSQLLAEHPSRVRRIIHGTSGEWFDKLSHELRQWTDGSSRKSEFQK